MRRLLTALPLALFLLLAVPAHAQQALVFEETEHDFGVIDEGTQARHVFTFTNAGDTWLRLTDVQPACGCTTPEWTRQPLDPGETGTITVVYDSEGRPGPFRRAISVPADGGAARLYIKGDVRPARLATGVPQGHLLIERETGDVGEVVPGDLATYTFRLQNDGARPVKILGVEPSSPAVSMTYPTAPIFPADLVELVASVQPEGAAGEPFEHTLLVETDDTEQPQKTLRLRGRIAPGTAAGSN